MNSLRIWTEDPDSIEFPFFFFFFFSSPFMAYRSSWVRDWIWDTAAGIHPTAAATMDPLTHYTGLRIEPTPLQWPRLLQSYSETHFLTAGTLKVSFYVLLHCNAVAYNLQEKSATPNVNSTCKGWRNGMLGKWLVGQREDKNKGSDSWMQRNNSAETQT